MRRGLSLIFFFSFSFFVAAVVTVVVVAVVVVSVSVMAEKASGDAIFTNDGSDARDNLLFALSTACRCLLLLLSISSCERKSYL